MAIASSKRNCRCSLLLLFFQFASRVLEVLGGGGAPAFFIFGDSLADSGNNNHYISVARANYYPYGISFPGGVATGRFSNGYTSMDYIAFKLGLPIIPIFRDSGTTGSRLLQGVNFASAGSGIDASTGRLFGGVTNFEGQLEQFAQVKAEIQGVVGKEAGTALIDKAVFFVLTGGNDWLNNYYLPLSPLPRRYSVPQFSDMLVAKLGDHIRALYELGARRVGVAGMGPLGCAPAMLFKYKSPNGSCVPFLNDISQAYNQHLLPLLLDLPRTSLPNATILYANLFKPLLDASTNPASFGFKYGHEACCGIGRYRGFLNCAPKFPVCDDVEDYLYFDPYHPTSKFDKQIVDLIWENGPPYSYPTSGRGLLAP